MYLQLAHTKLDACPQTRKFTLECYKITKLLQLMRSLQCFSN
ncbi:MAG: hypothetical protein JWQ40_3833 [Segetibacter sp.]|nr:hypothetical protein [Segetibacter sp.]